MITRTDRNNKYFVSQPIPFLSITFKDNNGTINGDELDAFIRDFYTKADKVTVS